MIGDFTSRCFVCGCAVDKEKCTKNEAVNLPVCETCKGSERERAMVKEAIEGLAEGFVCGCI